MDDLQKNKSDNGGSKHEATPTVEELIKSLDKVVMSNLVSEQAFDIEHSFNNKEEIRSKIQQKQLESFPKLVDVVNLMVRERDMETKSEIEQLEKELQEENLALQQSEEENADLCAAHAAKVESIKNELKATAVTEIAKRESESTEVNKDLLFLDKEHEKVEASHQCSTKAAHTQNVETEKAELQNYTKNTEILEKKLNKVGSQLKQNKVVQDEKKIKKLEKDLKLAKEKLGKTDTRKYATCEKEKELRQQIHALQFGRIKLTTQNCQLEAEIRKLQLMHSKDGEQNRLQKGLQLVHLRQLKKKQEAEIEKLNSTLLEAYKSIATLEEQVENDQRLLEIGTELKCLASEGMVVVKGTNDMDKNNGSEKPQHLFESMRNRYEDESSKLAGEMESLEKAKQREEILHLESQEDINTLQKELDYLEKKSTKETSKKY